ncbi:alpha/beta hydrolase [Aeromicrobium sp. CFBP 8757]|uniref:alpha/beta fold hydrolase n=1 Tax=Aeromicrobium sp. CFBP 8757 TaxID=2775288 RepID=UPI00177E173E|nr:alpha/beta hydrolase [Aeromicrobium sp. CFBP 8757]MBD8605416.1 alpha/beta hydrolase [Aeromicrobium sp. CFBP 8757]
MTDISSTNEQARGAVGATIPGVVHDRVHIGDTKLHVVSAGTAGSPVLLVHGFPESWWVFHRVIPLLAAHHRVFAVDLRGFGDSDVADESFSSAVAADDLRLLVEHLGVGPVHLVGQDISGGPVVRLAAEHPGLVRSLIATEVGLPGYGLEAFADVTNGGSWHLGFFAAPEVPALLLEGKERRLLADWAFPSMTIVKGAFGDPDLDELARGYTRTGGWLGAAGIYRSILTEGDALRTLLEAHPLRKPTLAIGGLAGGFTAATLERIQEGSPESVVLDGVGHHVAMEAPEAFAHAVTAFLANVDEDTGATDGS